MGGLLTYLDHARDERQKEQTEQISKELVTVYAMGNVSGFDLDGVMGKSGDNFESLSRVIE